MVTLCEIALRWMPENSIDDKSTMVLVMAWCLQATSHYLSQCWPRSMLLYGITGPQDGKLWSVFFLCHFFAVLKQHSIILDRVIRGFNCAGRVREREVLRIKHKNQQNRHGLDCVFFLVFFANWTWHQFVCVFDNKNLVNFPLDFTSPNCS